MSNELVQYLLEGTPLEEGVVAGYVTGIDSDELERIKAEARKNKISKSEKEKLLDQIDDAIDNSNRIWTDTSFLQAVASNFIPFAGVVKTVTRAFNGKDRKAYRESLHQARSVIAAMKTTD